MLPALDRGPPGMHVLVMLLGSEATRGEGRRTDQPRGSGDFAKKKTFRDTLQEKRKAYLGELKAYLQQSRTNTCSNIELKL
jgi:hypothetical protein